MTVIILIAGAALYVLVKHSAARTALTCSGKWERGVEGWQGRDETVYAVLEEYRPWIVWADSDGYFQAETKGYALMAYASSVHRIGSEPLVSYMFMDRRGGRMMGGCRRAPNQLKFQFTDALLFIGTCIEGI